MNFIKRATIFRKTVLFYSILKTSKLTLNKILVCTENSTEIFITNQAKKHNVIRYFLLL